MKSFEPAILRVDRLKLEEECSIHSEIYLQQARIESEAKEKVATTKAEFDLIQARLDKAIRDNPGKFGLGEKFTETMVKSRIVIHRKYQEAQLILNKAIKEFNDQAATVSALEHKKKMIELEVQLFLCGYYADPRVKNSKYDRDEEQMKARRERRETQNRGIEDDQ